MWMVAWKSFMNFKNPQKNIIDFKKKKNVTVNERRTKIILSCKSMLHLRKKNLTKAH